MLEIKNVSYSYHRKSPVLHKINLSLDTGFNLLIGENGSGKTTLIKNMTGILLLQQGEITLGGVPVSNRECRVNFSDAVFACCAFLRQPISDPLPLLRRKLLPVRPGRTAPRPKITGNRFSSCYASAR